MQIDVISDTVCPWCFIGKRRLARALEMRPDVEFDIQWRPYMLDPNVPRGGLDRQPYVWGKEKTPGGKWQANIWEGNFPNQDTGDDGFKYRYVVMPMRI